MKKDVFLRVLAEIKKNKNDIKVVVLYHGGEPLLNREFFSYVRKIKQVNKDFFLKSVSNGMSLNPDISRELIDCGLDEIEFSLDGISPEESQHVRRKSHTKQIISNVKYLIDLVARSILHKPEVCIATTQFLSKAPFPGAPSISPIPIWLRSEFKDDVKIKSTYAVKWPDMCVPVGFKVKTGKPPQGKAACDNVINTLTIRSDGTIVPCCYDLTTQLPMGNIRHTGLKSIWNGKKYKALRESIYSRKFNPMCANCAVVSTPQYLVPLWLCDINRRKYEDMR